MCPPPVSEMEIKTTVNKYKQHKASTDYNNIDMILIKKATQEILKPLTYICN